MLALTILLFGLVAMFIMVTILLLATGHGNLLPWVIILVPMLATLGSGMLGLIDLLLLFGGPDDRKTAKTELLYLGLTFLISAGLWLLSVNFLLKV
ncbi:MAG TPA: hypothetical protein PLP86_13670 [Armatimonadota bacterium]|jgi:hypothetical protein|nr:hypothetical protein [Armatimonadota bacterium]HOM73284.1 hypothetical protein [Armatimonadota bacterium]